MAPLDELQAQADAAAATLAEHETAIRHSAADAAAAAEAHVAAQHTLELATWVQAQLDNGVALEHIDTDRRVVTHLPLGPVHVAGDTNADGGGGAVTFAHDSAEADAIRRDPSQGAILAADQPTNTAAHLPYEAKA